MGRLLAQWRAWWRHYTGLCERTPVTALSDRIGYRTNDCPHCWKRTT